jgi:hypothetical protein
VEPSSVKNVHLPQTRTTPIPSPELWEAVNLLIDRATVDGILAHKLGPLAAIRWRELGRPLPAPLADEARRASLAMLGAVPLLQRIRDLCEGPLVLLKGPELASLYPPKGRRFGDVDVLTPKAEAVHHALTQDAFVVDASDFDHDEHHHLPPLRWPVIPLNVEVHSMPNWPPRMQPPPLAEILEASVPSALEIEGLSAPLPLHHALILSAHAWRHEPLETLRDLVDIAAVSAGQSVQELDHAARTWGIGRIWRTTQRAIDALFFSGPPTVPLRLWAQHLQAARDRTVLENHLQRLLHPFWGLPLGAALAEAMNALRVSIAPTEGETWHRKLKRVPGAVRDARVPLSERPGGGERAQDVGRRAPHT